MSALCRDMSSNRLTDVIPTTISNLVNISRINLHSNKLTGTLQPFVNLRSLTYLNVGDNLLTGEGYLASAAQ